MSNKLHFSNKDNQIITVNFPMQKNIVDIDSNQFAINNSNNKGNNFSQNFKDDLLNIKKNNLSFNNSISDCQNQDSQKNFVNQFQKNMPSQIKYTEKTIFEPQQAHYNKSYSNLSQKKISLLRPEKIIYHNQSTLNILHPEKDQLVENISYINAKIQNHILKFQQRKQQAQEKQNCDQEMIKGPNIIKQQLQIIQKHTQQSQIQHFQQQNYFESVKQNKDPQIKVLINDELKRFQKVILDQCALNYQETQKLEDYRIIPEKQTIEELNDKNSIRLIPEIDKDQQKQENFSYIEQKDIILIQESLLDNLRNDVFNNDKKKQVQQIKIINIQNNVITQPTLRYNLRSNPNQPQKHQDFKKAQNIQQNPQKKRNKQEFEKGQSIYQQDQQSESILNKQPILKKRKI